MQVDRKSVRFTYSFRTNLIIFWYYIFVHVSLSLICYPEDTVEQLLRHINAYVNVSDMMRDCFWFEGYRWWRKGPKPDCSRASVTKYRGERVNTNTEDLSRLELSM